MLLLRVAMGVFLALSLSGCGGGGGGDDVAPTGGPSDDTIPVTLLSDISGFWNTTRTVNDAQDIGYVEISTSGELTHYNYMGDGFDRGDDCYVVSAPSGLEYLTLTPTGAGTFLISHLKDGSTDTATGAIMRNSSSSIVGFSFTDPTSEMVDYLGTDNGVWFREIGAKASDYSPICNVEGDPAPPSEEPEPNTDPEPETPNTPDPVTNPQPNTDPDPVTNVTPGETPIQIICGAKRYCNQMVNCTEAEGYLRQCGLTQLDRDRDGIPCESLCN